MLAIALVLLAAEAEPDASVPPHYDNAPLTLDGRRIDFFPDAGTRPPEPPWLHIRGNRVLPEEMYRNALQLPAGTAPDAATAMYIEETLYGFLVKARYELATVGAVLTSDGIDVQIDEGQLEKIVFTGRLMFNTLRFRLELYVDQDVFNRPALERQIVELSERVGLPVVRWSLVPTANPDHVGPQIESLGIEGIQFLHGRKRYELWFYFQESEWDTGIGLDLRSGYIDGFEVGLNAQGYGLLGDRWRVAASGGAGLHFRISDHQLVPHFSRALAEFVWFSRPLGRVRVGTEVTANLYQRQRKDLDVENYDEANTIASVNTPVRLTRSAALTPALGVQWRRIFDIRTVANANPDLVPTPSQRVRAFAELRAEWVVDPENQRWDRRTRIDIGARYYFGLSLDPMLESQGPALLSYGWLWEHYQHLFEFGWHDLFIKSNARLVFGDVQFHDEQSVGELLRGVFGGYFVRKGGNAQLEFRFSLNRDVLKLSVFTDVASWGEVIDRQRGVEVFRFGVAAGPGLHALIQGMFQLDMYASFGVQTNGTLSAGAVVFLNKTY